MGFHNNNSNRSAFLNANGDVRDGSALVVNQNTNDKIDQVAADIAQIQSELTQSVNSLSEQIATILNATTQGVAADVEQLPITVSSGHNMIGYTGVNGIDAITAFNNSSVNSHMTYIV